MPKNKQFTRLIYPLKNYIFTHFTLQNAFRFPLENMLPNLSSAQSSNLRKIAQRLLPFQP
ncbi:hypothetical protein BOW57_01045 [Flavobacterium sp. YO64]|nr:hypothetical protein BOW57_01045 [Flavobacterium sp. YO64]